MKQLFIMLLLLAACTSQNESGSNATDEEGTEQTVGDTLKHTSTDPSTTDSTEEDTQDIVVDENTDNISTPTEHPSDSNAVNTDTQATDSIVGPTITCAEGSEKHITASGEVVCCPAAYPQFCDENEDGYSGGCWSEETLCDAITYCNEKWSTCRAGTLPFCDEDGLICIPCDPDDVKYEASGGRPFCCSADRPKFCDESDAGYPGGCWTEAIDCSTIIPCNESWGACAAGLEASCSDGKISCMPVPES